LHDAIIGERRGLPSAGIMTSNFVSAAALMARALGAEGYRFAVIEHPISSANPEELSARARTAAAQSVEILCGTRR
jgi:nicotinamidase-related amidase